MIEKEINETCNTHVSAFHKIVDEAYQYKIRLPYISKTLFCIFLNCTVWSKKVVSINIIYIYIYIYIYPNSE